MASTLPHGVVWAGPMKITSSIELADLFFLVAIVVSVIVTFLFRVRQWEKRRGLDPARGREQWLGVSRHLGLSPRDLHPERVHFTGTYRGTKLELRARSLGRDESKYRRSWEADLELNLRWFGLEELKERIYIERASVGERP